MSPEGGYTPDLTDGQSYYVTGRAQIRRQITGVQAQDITPFSREFDRMIADVKAEAWDEGYRTCDRAWTETADLAKPDEDRTDPRNPYREPAGSTEEESA